MELTVLNTSFEEVDVVDAFESMIWTDRYNTPGDFELYSLVDPGVLALLKKGYYLTREDSEHAMVIEARKIDTDEETGDHLVISGRSLESILDRRIVWVQTNLDGTLQNGIERLLNENAINPSLPERKIPNLIFEKTDDPYIAGLKLSAQYTGDNLLAVITNVCETSKIGFKLTLNEKKQLVFKLYNGTDRSMDQIANPHVIFAPDQDNMISSNYSESDQPFKNVTLVAGEDEGTSRRTAVVGSSTGLYRRELFTDARDIQSENEDGTKIDNATYQSLLEQRGTENLFENQRDISFESSVDTTYEYDYGVDYFMGDVVTAENEYGVGGRARIVEYIYSEDTTGYKEYPTFEMIDEEEDRQAEIKIELLESFQKTFDTAFNVELPANADQIKSEVSRIENTVVAQLLTECGQLNIQAAELTKRVANLENRKG